MRFEWIGETVMGGVCGVRSLPIYRKALQRLSVGQKRRTAYAEKSFKYWESRLYYECKSPLLFRTRAELGLERDLYESSFPFICKYRRIL